MNKLISTIFIILCSSFCSVAQPESQRNESKVDSNTIKLSPNKPPNNRPNIPPKTYILCTYTNKHLSFVFSPNIREIQIFLGDEMFPIWEGYVNNTYPEVDIPPIIGETPITCEDDRGRKYHGILNFKE